MTKELEALERLNQTINLAENFYDAPYEDKDLFAAVQRDVDTIKQALIKAQEQEKVLEIIKEKEVDVHLLKACITCYTDSLNAYNSEIKKLYSNHKDYQNKPLSFYLLTQEEFDILKEALKCQD